MFSDFLASRKKEERIPDISEEILVILDEMPKEVKVLLQNAQLLEKKQIKEKDLQKRKEFCEKAWVEYQKAKDLVEAGFKKYKDFPQKQDAYIGQSFRIKNRMEYLEDVLRGIKEMKRRKAA